MLEQVTLESFIRFNTFTRQIDSKYTSQLSDDMSDTRRSVLASKLFIDKAKITYSNFAESTLDISKVSVDSLIGWYTKWLAEFTPTLPPKWWRTVGLPTPELTHTSPITFGQFVDAKMIVEAAVRDNKDQWAVTQYIMSIFLIGSKKKYDYLYTSEDNSQFIRCGKKSVAVAVLVAKWWDTLNTYTAENYTIFQKDAGVDDGGGENVADHMERWGWVNFLKNVAKAKVFDIQGSGLNSIDCVRETKASEVLVWASEEKDHNVAIHRDMKALK